MRIVQYIDVTIHNILVGDLWTMTERRNKTTKIVNNIVTLIKHIPII